MPLPFLTLRNFDVLAFKGMVTVTSLSHITPELTRYVESNTTRHLVVDLSAVEMIDSSTMRLFINIKKRMDTARRDFYLLKPSDAVDSLLRSTNLYKIVPLITSITELDDIICRRFRERYLPYTTDHKGLRKLNLSCPVCGSIHVVGYLLNDHDYDWEWENDSIFPASFIAGTRNAFDYFSALPIICTECFMCSTDIGDFNVVQEKQVVIHSGITDLVKHLLSKSISKRKKMMQVDGDLDVQFFECPRNTFSVFNLYRLADTCAQTEAVKKASESSFHVGFLNYQSLKYAAPEQQPLILNECRSWLSLVESDSSPTFHTHRAQSMFILIACSLRLDKITDASTHFNQFTKMMESLPALELASGLNNPAFWYAQAKRIWEVDDIPPKAKKSRL
jgi:anti-anti-sigma factor